MTVSLIESIKQTISYAKFFDYDLTAEELSLWLISARSTSLSNQQINKLTNQLSRKRIARLRTSQAKFAKAHRVAQLLSALPSIEMVAVTGSLAMNNAKKNDDIDLMIITQDGALWLTRLFVIPLVRLFFKARFPVSHPRGGRMVSPGVKDSICLNLWLDTSVLSLSANKRSLYTAHEVLQIKPLLNRHYSYERFIMANSWTKTYLANAYKTITASFPPNLGGIPRNRRGEEYLTSALPLVGRDGLSPLPPHGGGLGWGIILWLNSLAFRVQFLYMKSKMTSETVSLHSAFFHPRSLAKDLEKHIKSHSL